MRDGQADLHPRLIGLYGLAFADALHLARIQRIQLVFVVALMCANAFGGLKPRHQLCECQRVGVDDHWRRALALHFAHDHPENRALTLDHGLETLELRGVGLALGLAALTHFVACNLQKTTVHRMRVGFVPHRGVNRHACELLRLDRPEKLLQPCLAHNSAKATDLRGLARQPMLAKKPTFLRGRGIPQGRRLIRLCRKKDSWQTRDALCSV